jgi:hypothetical protein
MLTSVCGVLRVSCRGYATKKSRWNIFGGGAKNADMYEVRSNLDLCFLLPGYIILTF